MKIVRRKRKGGHSASSASTSSASSDDDGDAFLLHLDSVRFRVRHDQDDAAFSTASLLTLMLLHQRQRFCLRAAERARRDWAGGGGGGGGGGGSIRSAAGSFASLGPRRLIPDEEVELFFGSFFSIIFRISALIRSFFFPVLSRQEEDGIDFDALVAFRHLLG